MFFKWRSHYVWKFWGKMNISLKIRTWPILAYNLQHMLQILLLQSHWTQMPYMYKKSLNQQIFNWTKQQQQKNANSSLRDVFLKCFNLVVNLPRQTLETVFIPKNTGSGSKVWTWSDQYLRRGSFWSWIIWNCCKCFSFVQIFHWQSLIGREVISRIHFWIAGLEDQLWHDYSDETSWW